MEMNKTLHALLQELEEFGINNDAVISERPRRMLNITRDTGEFLSVLVRATNAKRVLEIGTSNGYSTLWLAQAAVAIGGHVTTLERSDFKRQLAAKNFEHSGIAHAISQVPGEAADFLNTSPDACYDLIFLDSERAEYLAWQANLKRILREGGLLVVDNATSHASEMASFVELISADGDFTHCTVPVGNGEFLATRSGRRSPSSQT
jgi:predicted O-methyltransferase YrrM